LTLENKKHFSNCYTKGFTTIGASNKKNLETLQYLKSLQFQGSCLEHHQTHLPTGCNSKDEYILIQVVLVV